MHIARPSYLTTVFAIALVSAALAPARACASAPGGEAVDITLVLVDAVFGAEKRDDGKAIIVNVRRDDRGRWERVWGFAPRVSAAFIDGHVDWGVAGGGMIEIDVTLKLPHDGWTPGGRGSCQVSLKETDRGRYEGTYKGAYRGVAVEGPASASVRAASAAAPAGFQPVRPGERPRILFRKGDIPRLKRRLNTDLGKAAIATWGDDAVSMGMRYWLLDDESMPAKARGYVTEQMNDRGCGSKNCRGRLWASRLEQIAIGYDMFHDAWNAAFRRKVREYLLGITRRLFYSHGSFQKEINWRIDGEMAGPIYYGAAVAGLAVWGEKGPCPPEPSPVPDAPPTIGPLAGYAPGRGVPVVKLASGVMPEEWLMACGFRPKGDDALRGAGGSYSPEEGTELSYGARTATFRRVPKGKDEGYWNNPKFTQGRTRLDVTNASGRAYNSANYFFTVVENDRSRYVRYSTSHGDDETYLAGVRIHDGEVMRLAPGLLPLLVCVRIGETVPWGKIASEPRFMEITRDEANQELEERRARYEELKADWLVDRELWRRDGGASVRCQRAFELSRWIMYTLYREFVGDGGGQTVYRLHGLVGPHKYAALYRGMFGTDVSPYPDITHFLPRKIVSHVYTGAGKIAGQGLRGREGYYSGGFWDENTDVSRQLFAGLFPVVPEEYKPATLWAWNYHAGVNGSRDVAKVLNANHPYGGEGPDSVTDVFAFLNYPLSLRPVHPKDAMARTWEVSGNGQYIFRNDFDGRDDFIVQVLAQTRGKGPGGSGGDAGAFRIMGLGEKWTDGTAEYSGDHWNESTVKLPNDPVNTRGAGRVTYAEMEADGSGVVSIDLHDVYSGSAGALYELHGGVRFDENFEDLGISGLRSIGVDYSRKSGAPCLFVVVDTIRGGGTRTWAWQLLREYAGKGGKGGEKTAEDYENVKLEGNRFTITKGDKTLVGTFVAPGALDAEVVMRVKGTVSREPHPTLFATGGDDFFVVATIQRGAAPRVSVEGEGLEAVVTVGDQVVGFDGTKVVFGAAEVAKIRRDGPAAKAASRRAGTRERRPFPWTDETFPLPAPRGNERGVDPEDAVYTLVLRRALGSRFEGAMDLNAYVDKTRAGFREDGLGWSPRFNICSYDCDPSGLTLAGDRLSGTLRVKMYHEPWTPEDAKPVSGTYAIQAELRDGRIIGTYKGEYNNARLWGEVVGLAQKRPPDRVASRVWLRSPKSIYGHKNHSYATRVMMDFVLARGGAASNLHVQIPNGKSAYDDGMMDGSKCRLDLGSTSFGGTMDFEITKIFARDTYSKTGYGRDEANQCGRYRMRLTGRRVGDIVAGDITSQFVDATEFTYKNNKKLARAREAAKKKGKKPKKAHRYSAYASTTRFVGGVLPVDAPAPKMRRAERLGKW